MKIRNLLAVGIGAYLASMIVLSYTNPASAAYRRVHSSQCHYYYDNAGTDVYNAGYLASNTAGHGIYCPAPSDSLLPHASTVTLNVHGYSPAANSTYSQACVKAFNTVATSCGALKYWAMGYAGVLGVSTASWAANPAGMPYVYSYLPAGSRLYGFYMSN